MKTTYTLMATAALALTLSATPSNANNAFFTSGFVAGGALGYSHMTNKVEKFGAVPSAPAYGLSKKTETSNAFVWSLDGGYRHVMENGFVIGVNLGISKDYNETKKTDILLPTIESRVKMHRLYQITPSLFIGKTLAERWMIFTDLGLSISRFKINGTSTSTLTGKTLGATKTFTKIGFAPAIGTEYAVNQHLAVTGKVTYEFFGSTKKDLSAPVLGVDSTHSTKVKPRYFTAKVGVLYKF